MAFNSADTAAFKNVWVFCEQRQGVMMPTTFELISEGRKLANELGVELCGILLGDNVDGIAAELGEYGADKVYVYNSPLLKDFTTDAYTKVIVEAVEELKPEVLLAPPTSAVTWPPAARLACTPVCARTAPTWTSTCPTTRASCAKLPPCPRSASRSWAP